MLEADAAKRLRWMIGTPLAGLQGMRINSLPFVFAPGAALLGYWLGGGQGVWIAVSAWGAIVAAATTVSWWAARGR